jgi:hypothetical protein
LKTVCAFLESGGLNHPGRRIAHLRWITLPEEQILYL